MEILLWKTVEKLGERGDVVDVSPGYARNYLFRKGWATPATDGNRQRLDEQEERLKREEQKRIEKNREKASALEDAFCVIRTQCNEEGNLFGSVTPKTVASAVEEQFGIEISAKQVALKKPIKEVGTYKIPISLHPKVKTELYTWVVQSDLEEQQQE